MSRQDDAQELRRRLEDDIEGVLDALYPGWVKRGKIAYLTPKNKKELGSFTVALEDGKMPRGCFYRFSQSIGGGSVELVAYGLTGRKDAYKESFEWTRRHFGIDRSEESQEDRAAREAHQSKEKAGRDAKAKKDAIEAERKKQAKVLNVQDIWAESKPLAGTMGEQYLISRGIPPISEWPWKPDDALRFHPSLDYEPDRDVGNYPAIVCKVVDAFNDHIALWIIYLKRDKPEKADLSPSPKIGRGPATGGAIRIGGDAAEIDGAEGAETALGAWFLEGHRRPVWSFMSTSGMKNFEPPTFVERLGIWRDGDKAVMGPQGRVLPPPGQHAAEELQKRMKSVGIKCPINDVCRDGDALDLWNARQKFEKRIVKEDKNGEATKSAS